MFRLATSLLSPGGARGRLSAFIFHRVVPAHDPLQPSEPDAEQFDRILGWIGSQFRVLSPLEACERLFDFSLPPRAAVITFDDGYRDNCEVALPLLQRHRMTAAFFIATGYLNDGTMFNDRVLEAVRAARTDRLDAGWLGLGVLELGAPAQRRVAVSRLLQGVKYLPPAQRLAAVSRIEDAGGGAPRADLMMGDDQVRQLSRAGMQVGGHTRSHPILRSLDDGEALREIAAGRDDLRAITGEVPALFAYPNGKLGDDFDERHQRMARYAGFRFAFTTEPGASRGTGDRFLIRRHTPWARTQRRFRSQALRNLLEAGS